jgi:hypothetical protein
MNGKGKWSLQDTWLSLLQSLPLLFPERTMKSKKMDQMDKERVILDVFNKIEVNIPLLEAINQIPKYAKFFKEMCTNKRKLKGNSRVNVSRNVCAITQQTGLPEKCEDPRVFTVPCTIGDSEFENCMLDLGSSILCSPLFKSKMQFSNSLLPMLQGIVKTPGSSHFSDSHVCCMIAETFLVMLTLEFSFSFLLLVHTSFKNFAYFGICLIASRRGMFTSIFLKTSKIPRSLVHFHGSIGEGKW